MKSFLAALIISILFLGCSHVNRLSKQKVSGSKNLIFIRPFSGEKIPVEVTKLLSERFYSKLTSKEFFSGSDGKLYSFDFYFGQPCPNGFDCYYITGEVSAYKYEEGCCGRDGVEVSTMVRLWDDLTKKPLFEVSEWNSEVFEPEDVDQLQAIELLADDSTKTLVDALLKELSSH